MRFFLSISLMFNLSACNNSSEGTVTLPDIANAAPVEVAKQDGLERAYFASGCFWCVEAIFESVAGVKEVISGYSGGHTKNPTYDQTNTGNTGHAEAVEVLFNPDVIDFATLTDVYFGSMDPTQKNGQGPDLGSQYRSIIFYQNEEQKAIIEDKIKKLAAAHAKAISVEVLPFQKFWQAEPYHQDYKRLNPDDPYIRNVSVPRQKAFEKKFPHLLKENAGKSPPE